MTGVQTCALPIYDNTLSNITVKKAGVTITTPSELVNSKLVINGAGAKISDVVVTDTNREFGFAVYFIELRPFHVLGLSLDSSREVVHLIFGVICL